jgi:hypothetical protein
MTNIDLFKLLQMINNLAERYTLEVQVERDGDCMWVRPHVLETLILRVPSVATGHALEPLKREVAGARGDLLSGLAVDFRDWLRASWAFK